MQKSLFLRGIEENVSIINDNFRSRKRVLLSGTNLHETERM